MDANYSPALPAEYNALYAMNRALYSVLAIGLWHDPLVAVQIVALWLWLERLGFKDVVKKISSLQHAVINEFAEEALTCLSCICNPDFLHSAEVADMPLTSGLMKRTIYLQLLVKNRDTVLSGIRKISETCFKVFADLIEEAVEKHAARDLELMMTLSPALEDDFIHSFANMGFGGLNGRINSDGESTSTVHPVHRFATSEHQGETPQSSMVGRRLSMSEHQAETSHGTTTVRLQSGKSIRRFVDLGHPRDIPSSASSPVPSEERSMFITFSKGYPISEAEMADFFTMIFGDCIEYIKMQPVRRGEQALYAQVVFRVPSLVELVLNGLPKAKFTINGKHLWMRKFIPKNAASYSSWCN